MAIRTLLADDHEIVLDGLAALLEKEAGIEVVGKARNGREAVRAARELEPDLIIMDLSMPEMNGMEAIRQIRAEQPQARVICLSMHTEKRFVAAAFESGAAGYILKDRTAQEVLQGIQTVMKGRSFVCSQIASTLVEDYSRRLSEPSLAPSERLSSRENEVLQLIAEGHSTKDIASRLHLSEKTVATHRAHLKRKLGIKSTAGLTKYALRHGLTSADRHL